MKEHEILRAILRETNTGWWEADIARRRVRLSGMLQSLLRLQQPTISFDEFFRFAPPAYDAGSLFLARKTSVERIIPLNTPDGRVWLAWKVLEADTQSGTVTGYVYPTDEIRDDSAGVREPDRVNGLLYRLNSIRARCSRCSVPTMPKRSPSGFCGNC